MSITYVNHKCYECGYEDELPIISGLVQCPYCDTRNDVWEVSAKIPDRHKRLEAKNRVKRKLLRYGREFD